MQINVINRNICTGLYRLFLLALLAMPFIANAQSFELTGTKKRCTLPFKMIRNMVIVEMKINGRGPFNFILDTGVGIMIITDPKMVDSINLESKRSIKIYGLNGENYEAFVTPNLNIEMRNIVSRGVSAAILKKDHFGLSNYAGMPIHGLLGYDFFANLAVRFNFNDSTLSVCRPQYVSRLRRGIKIPIEIQDQKPYFTTAVKMPGGASKQRKLLIDIGAGHPLSLDNILKEDGLPQNFIAANLGVGLTGPISGYISRVDEIALGNYRLKNVITSFLDMESLKRDVPAVPRDGSIGLGALKRFTLLLDYSGGAMYLKRGADYNEPFEHDMTGMEYFYDGDDFSHLAIGRVEPGSAAAAVGLKAGDEIVSINFRPIEKYTIEQIDNLFRSRDGRNLLLEVYRYDKYNRVLLTLKKRI